MSAFWGLGFFPLCLTLHALPGAAAKVWCEAAPLAGSGSRQSTQVAQYEREGNKTPFLPLISCYNGKRVAKVFCIPIDSFLTLKQDSASPTCINCQNNCGVDVKTNADTSRCSRLFLQKACQESLRWNKKYFYSVLHVLKVSLVNSGLHGACLLWLGIP